MIMNRLLCTFMLLFVSAGSFAQGQKDDVPIEPLQTTSIYKWRTDIYVSGSWCGYKNGNLWTANNNIGKEKSECYLNFTDLCIEVDCYRDRGFYFEGSVGYTCGTIAYTRSLFPNSGVRSHWITFDANISHIILLDGLFCGGIKSAKFVGSYVNNIDYYSFEGLYDDCFNSLTFVPYFGFRLRFQYIKFEAKIGGQVVPFLNANKIAYHNMHKTYVDGLFFEVKLGIKLFSTSNPSRPVNYLFSNL